MSINSIDSLIQQANDEALSRLKAGRLRLIDIAPAGEVIPWLKGDSSASMRLLVSGPPPVDYTLMCGAQQGACKGMVIFEGWASSPAEADALLRSGRVSLAACHDHGCAGPMAGTISRSMPVFVVRNETFATLAFSRPADLAQQFGDPSDLSALRTWALSVAPPLRAGVLALGGLDMDALLRAAHSMGDESHNRNNAMTSAFLNCAALGMARAGVAAAEMEAALDWLSPLRWEDPSSAGVRACLGLVLACAKALMDPLHDIPHSTIVTTMARNGVSFGIRVSGLGADQWFISPSPVPIGKFFPPYTQEDAGGDMGDSAITETAGWGSFILDNSPSFLANLPVDIERAKRISIENTSLTLDRNPNYPIPTLAFQGNPIGIDLRRIVHSQITPVINTGIAHREEGHRVIGRGLVQAPLACFVQAAEAFNTKYQCEI